MESHSVTCHPTQVNTRYQYHIIISYTIDLKRQNRLQVGTDNPKLKVKMQSVSEDDIRKKTLLEMPHFELAAKGTCRPI